MNLTTQKLDDVLVIEIEGEIMGGTDADEFRTVLYNAIDDEIIHIVVDLDKAVWMNSSGLGMLIAGLSTLRSSEGDLRLANVSERVRRPLEITKLDAVFSIYESVDAAVNSYK